jgi:hypothetical protein
VEPSAKKEGNPIQQSEVLKRNQQKAQPEKTKKSVSERIWYRFVQKTLQKAKEIRPVEEGMWVYGGGLKPKHVGPSEADTPALHLYGDPNDIKVCLRFRDSDRTSTLPGLLHEPACWKRVPLEERLRDPKVLRLGLDMGTSATKVVVMDPARDEAAWAIPFFSSGPNPYLLPTAIVWNDESPVIETRSNALRPFKWALISDSLTTAIWADAASYLALVLRHVVAWLNHSHGTYYTPDSLIWEVRIGLPAASSDNVTLCRNYLALLDLAVDIAATEGQIERQRVLAATANSMKRIKSGGELPVDRNFEVSGMLLPTLPTPEIAANIAGFYRSGKWDPKIPFGLMVDVGASTLDCAFCSFVDRQGKMQLSEFSRTMEPLGVFRLHDSRVEWLLDQLSAMHQVTEATVSRILEQLTSIGFEQPIPDYIQEYLENVEIEGDAIDDEFGSRVAKVVHELNLLGGGKRFFGGTIPQNSVIPVYISGGGARHFLYKSLLRQLSDNRNFSWTLRMESLGIPDFVKTPGAPANARDRLAVAYGLCSDEAWAVNYPETIGDFRISHRDYRVSFVSKDVV